MATHPIPSLRPDPTGEGLAWLAQALLALRTTSDLGTTCSIAGSCAMSAVGATDFRLLRVDLRSGALRSIDDSGIETPYLAEPGGPVEWVLAHEQGAFDEGGAHVLRETLLWTRAPEALATLPLESSGTLHGFLLLAFPSPHGFAAEERLLLQVLADALALAFERAEMRLQTEEARARVDELDARVQSCEESSSRLMSVVAHEIRSPLTAIKAYTEALLDSLQQTQAPRERFLGIINDECDRLARLVTDILDLSRLEAGQQPLRLARFELAQLARETLDGLMPMAKARKIRFDLAIEDGLIAEADPDLVRRLLINLVGNAIKFSPNAGFVRLAARTVGEEWTVDVEDQGPGIPAEDLPRVFERFFRARPTGQEVDGTGLGLAIARGIVELHGGRIHAESLAPHGTRFTFSLALRQMATGRARRIARQLWAREDVRELFEATVEMVAATMDAGIVSLMLVDPDHGDLVIAASYGLEGHHLVGRRTTVRSGVAGAVAAWGRPLLVDNIETDRRFRRLNHPQYRTKSLLCVPIAIEREVLGVVNVNNKHSGESFDADDLAVLGALAERVGSAVERAIAHPESDRMVQDALHTVRSVTALRRDCLLGGHELVRRCRATARALGMAPSDVDLVGYVASIHDLGMTRVPPSPHALGDDARRDLVTHPEASVEILRPLEYLGSVRAIILSHHERWDGTGYPRQLRGEDIPLGARILAVADAWESMTRGRPWRAALTPDQASTELRAAAGTQFDPTVVEAFLGAWSLEGGRR